MKRIVFVMPQLYGGGAERVTAVLANEMCKVAGSEIHMITYTVSEKDFTLEDRIKKHSPQLRLNGSDHQILSKLSYLRKKIRAINPCCVVSLAGPSAAILLLAAMTGLRIPLILSERNDPRHYPSAKVFRIARLIAYRLCDGLVFQTGEARDYFPAAIRKKGTVICNPITNALPERFDGVREPRIVNWCRLTPQKNLDLLIEAFGDIVPDFPTYTLEIYGEGSEKERLTEKINRMGLADKIILHGYSDHIYEEVRKASVFVSSSDYEGISNSMLEAIALGVPSICTDCPAGGAREVIETGVNGLLTPVGDKEKLVSAMRTLLSDPCLAGKLSVAGSALREKLSGKSVAEQWMAYIHKVLQAG